MGFKKFITAILLFIAGYIQLAIAQSPIMVFDKLEVPGFTRVIFQDSRGFKWFGTRQGVFRYDGLHYRHYDHKSEDANSISSNEVWSIAEDSDHYIWFGTQTGGLSRYDYSTNKFLNFLKDTTSQNTLHENEVLCIAADKNGHIWAATSGGGLVKVLKDDHSTNGYRFYSFIHVEGDSQSLASDKIWALAFDDNNFGYAGTFNCGLSIFNASLDFKSVRFRNISIDRIEDKSKKLRIDGFFYDRQNKNIWIYSSQSALLVFDQPENPMKGTLEFKDVLKSFNDASQHKIVAPLTFFTDSKNQCWLSTDDGGSFRFQVKFLPAGKIEIDNVINLTKNDAVNTNIKDELIASFYEDNFQNIWIGTESGVLKYSLAAENFQFSAYREIFSPLQDQKINYVYQNRDGEIFFSTNQNYFWVYKQKQLIKIFFDFVDDKSLSTNIKIAGIRQLHSGDYLISGYIGTIKLPLSEYQKAIAIKNYKPKIPANNFVREYLTPNYFPFVETKDGRIFIGTGGGLFELNSETMKVYRLNFSIDTNNLSQRIRTVIAMPDNILWVGTDLGIYAFNYVHQQPVNFKSLINQKSIVPEEYISVLKKSDDGNVWIGTGNALYKYDAKTKTISHTQLSNEHIAAIESDKNNNVWIGSYNGILNLNAKVNLLYSFTKSDGLVSSTIYESGSTKLNDGTVVMCGDKGINYFQPDSIKLNNTQSSICITNFEVNYVSVMNDTSDTYKLLRKKFFNHEILQLGSDQKTLKFEFAALNYLSPEKNKYQFKLEGFDNLWNDLGNNSFAYYSSVKAYRASLFFPGVYTFLVRVKNADGSWLEMQNPLQLSIKPYWAKSIEFLSILAILILGVIIYIVRYLSHQKLKEQLREQEKLLAIERERNRISEDLHDDLGAGLSSIAMMTGVMKDLVTDDASKETAEDVSSEATELVGRMREIIWSMNSKNDTIENLISYLHEYSDKYLKRNKIECDFKLQGNVPDKNISGDKRESVFLVTKETLHNIVKYAQSPLVNLNVTIDEKKLTVEVFDNGKGFDMNSIGRFGNGLTNMKQRLETVGGNYQIESAVGNGTRTKIQVGLN
ncbi:MAG: two-component regulator propeller domain-containing protein [Bacteroidia bacterium]